MNLNETLEFAQDIARKTGEIILTKKDGFKVVDYKDRQDIVTSVDLEAEKYIISSIKNKFPSHSIYSEEAGDNNLDSAYKWIIDPLDGTKEYIRDIPMHNTSFALEKNGEPILSVVYRPSNNTMYGAAVGVGAFKNDKLVTVSGQKKLDQSFVFSYLPTYKVNAKDSKEKYKTLYQLSRSCYRLRGIAEESASLCWVGSAMIEASINLGPQPKWHDIVPGMLFAKVAGAKITDIYGNRISGQNLQNGFVISNGHVHKEIINITSKIK